MTPALQKVFLSLSLICFWDSGDCNSMSYSTCSSYSLTLTLLPLMRGICSPHLNLIVSDCDALWPPILSHKRWYIFCLTLLGHSLDPATILLEAQAAYTEAHTEDPSSSHQLPLTELPASTNMWANHLGSGPTVTRWADAMWSGREESSTQIPVDIEDMNVKRSCCCCFKLLSFLLICYSILSS